MVFVGWAGRQALFTEFFKLLINATSVQEHDDEEGEGKESEA